MSNIFVYFFRGCGIIGTIWCQTDCSKERPLNLSGLLFVCDTYHQYSINLQGISMNQKELRTKLIEHYGTTLAALALNTNKQTLNSFRSRNGIRTPSNDAVNTRLAMLIKASIK